MSWYAVDEIENAIGAARRFLFPFEFGRWLRLAVIVLFLGGGAGSFDLPGNAGTLAPPDVPTPGPGPGLTPPPELSDSQIALLVGIVALVVVIGLALALISATMQFVFLDSLRTNELHLREYFGDRLGKGVRLFGFQIVVGLLVALSVGVIGFVGLELASPTAGPPIGLVAVLAPVLVAIGLFVALLFGFTTAFVTAVMIAEDVGVLAGWRRFLPTLRREWKQYGLFVVVRFVLGIAAGILGALVTGLVVLGALVAFGALGALVVVGLGGLEAALASTVGVAALGALGVVFVVCALAAVLAVQIPITTYLRCYALLVLGDTNPAFDLVAELRPAEADDDTPSAAG